MTTEQQLIDYKRVEQAIEFIALNHVYQPSLEDIAYAVKMSPNHFQRQFTRWAGISPKKFLQYITLEKSRERL
ncbi:MAG: AraC family transcriptional regulator [Bacteroidia bacterium]|nr:MAG: AraC family transcriptional regulator [Bacteroidia bacterium]